MGQIVSVKRDAKKGELTIVVKEENPHRLSKSKENVLVATTGGNRETDCVVEGQNLIVGVNAYYPSDGEEE